MSRTSTVLGRLALVTAGALFGTVLLVPGGSQAAESHSTRTVGTHARPVLSSDFGKAKSRIEGTFRKSGVVTGTFTPKRFKTNNAHVLKAVGVLHAKLIRGDGKVIGHASRKITIPVASIEGTSLVPNARVAARAPSCDVLNLVLGPLDLDLLGLQVHLDKVVLNIIAATGAGNLLGNLLCAVAGLLDGTGGLGALLPQITQILNSILAILRL
jgi:hypothetical protein